MGERAGLNGGVQTAWVQGFKGKEGKGKERKGRERKGKEGKGRERKGKEGKRSEREEKGRERKGKEGKGREEKGRERKGKEGKGRDRKGRKGKEGKGMTGKRRRWRSASLAARTAARVAGNGWGDEAAGDQRAWLRGRLRTGNGCGELRGRLRTAWVQGWLEMGGETKPLEISELGCADGCGREMGAENCVDGCGRRGCKGGWKWVGTRRRWRSASLAARTAAEGKWVGRIARTAADGVGARECWKWPLVMSELGCADGCGREMGAENCVDGCGRRGCKGVAGNGWGEEAAGDERAWLGTANGCGELRGRLRTAWVQGGGWKWVGRRSRCGQAWVQTGGRLRTAWVQGGGWKWVGRRSRW